MICPNVGRSSATDDLPGPNAISIAKADTDANTRADTDADACADTDADSDTDADPDTNADTGSNTDAYTGSDADANSGYADACADGDTWVAASIDVDRHQSLVDVRREIAGGHR